MTAQRGRVRTEPGAKRVRVYVGGVAVADTLHPLYVWENPHYPAYYIPLTDVRDGVLVPSATTTHSPSRGDARHYTVEVDGTRRVDAAWRYAESPIEELRDHVRFDWDAMDAWFEEDEEVFTHPRSPYTRIDILPSSRHVQVRVGDTVVADTVRAHVLHETGLPPRWYLPKVDVRMDLLQPTESVTHCPYKGQARYWSAHVDGRVIEDAVWSYRTPLRESANIAGLVSFYPDKVDVFVDGAKI